LIHLCEKGVVVPDVHDASGRGSSRVFSARNFLELAVSLKLREMMLPVTAVGAVVHVLRTFEHGLRQEFRDFSLADSLRGEDSPDLRIIISDGETIYFSLAPPNGAPKLFGGVPLTGIQRRGSTWDGRVDRVMGGRNTRNGSGGFGGPEHSQFVRMELSVTAVASALPLD